MDDLSPQDLAKRPPATVSSTTREEPGHGWPRTVFWMFALALATGAFLFVFQSCRNLPAETMERGADKLVQVVTNVSRSLRDIAAAFNQGTITVTMDSFGTEIENTKRLQFKTIRQTELFTHTDHASTGFGYVQLPDVIVEARARVEYVYYLDLESDWQFVVRGREVFVHTPTIRFNKPSIDVSSLKYEVRQGSFFRDSQLAMENLQRSLSSLAFLKAEENLRLVRHTGRDTVREFVEEWLMHSFSDGDQFHVRILFPGEEVPAESVRDKLTESNRIQLRESEEGTP